MNLWKLVAAAALLAGCTTTGIRDTWGRNWCRSSVPAGAVQLLYSMREFLRIFTFGLDQAADAA